MANPKIKAFVAEQQGQLVSADEALQVVASRPGSGSGSCKTPKRSRVLQMNLADASDYAGAHHRTSLTHHRVSGVGVSQTELEPAAYAGSGS